MKQSGYFFNSIIKENPVFFVLAGLCPLLARTTTIANSMGIAVTMAIVFFLSGLAAALLKKTFSRGTVLLIVIVISSFFTSLADHCLSSYLPGLRYALGIYLPLIAVNCLIIMQTETGSSPGSPGQTIVKATGTSVGLIAVFAFIGGLREIFGHGTVLGKIIFAQGPVTFLILPPGAFIFFGIIKAIVNRLTRQVK